MFGASEIKCFVCGDGKMGRGHGRGSVFFTVAVFAVDKFGHLMRTRGDGMFQFLLHI